MTMIINWQDLTPETFLNDYWQKKPLLIKGAFSDFNDPIDANELAGLAMEDFIESRIISKSDNNWDVAHGPFEDFEQFGAQNWTLLVQAVNHWFDDVDDLLTPFRFLPNWRVDDVMVSFSTPNAGVGPHLDQYDVFIIQGEGKRHWRVGAPDSTLIELLPHEDLKQVSSFTAIIDEVTEPGDLLYIPPNHPHDGIAIENSLNYSIGFQAPNTQELLSGLADHSLDNNTFMDRLNDKARQVTSTPHILDSNDLEKLTSMLTDDLSDPDVMPDFYGKYLTSVHHALNLLIPVEPLSFAMIEDILSAGEVLKPVLGIKCLIVNSNENKTLFINGEKFALAPETIGFANELAEKKNLTIDTLKSSIIRLKNQQLLTTVINKGFWCF